jgi:hypothetical protein
MRDQLSEIRCQLETLRDEYQDDVDSQAEYVGGIIHGLNEALRIVESVSANPHPPHRS